MAQVQTAISRRSRPTRDKWHDTTDASKIVSDLVALVQKQGAPKRGKYDGNMRTAAVLSYVLATWFLRVQRAKAYDPRRPVRLRKDAMFRWADYAAALFRSMVDESEDQEHFPGQKWETPFDPYPTDGFFV